MNSLMLIAPYQYEGMWVFDDPKLGLLQEPFVSDAGSMIDHLVADIPEASTGFRLLFSATPFPGATLQLNWARAELSGNWYTAPDWNMEGWLCPALFKYFDTAPPHIYVRAEARK